MRSSVAKLALAAASVTLTLAFCEAVLRGVAAVTPASDRRGLHEPRPDRGWLYGLRPGVRGKLEATGDVVYDINVDGFRDASYARRKPAGTFRVIVLGDSIAFGYGVQVDKTFPKVMEQRLRLLAKGRPVEVLNLGVSGYNPYTQGELLEDVGAGYDPDLVLVQFCINDIDDPTSHFDVHARLHLNMIPDAAYPDPSARRVAAERPGRTLRWCRRSRLCSLVDDVVVAAQRDEAQRDAEATSRNDDDGAWQWLEERYQEMARSSRALGADFAIIAVPYRAQLATPGKHPVQQRFVRLSKRNAWVLIDPLTALRVAARRGETPFLDLWHPTPAGHLRIANAAIAALVRADLIPGG